MTRTEQRRFNRQRSAAIGALTSAVSLSAAASVVPPIGESHLVGLLLAGSFIMVVISFFAAWRAFKTRANSI
jgi:hypothetical protein